MTLRGVSIIFYTLREVSFGDIHKLKNSPKHYEVLIDEVEKLLLSIKILVVNEL